MKLVRPTSLGGGTNFFKNLRKFLASLLSTKSHVLNTHTHITQILNKSYTPINPLYSGKPYLFFLY